MKPTLKYLSLAFALAFTACEDVPSTPPTTGNPDFPGVIDPSALDEHMEILGVDINGDNSVLFGFELPLDGRQDLEPRPEDGVYGTSWWRPGDRHRYDTAWAYFTHKDPGQHSELRAFRVVIQAYGDYKIQINDRGLVELFPQGLPPYPYEPDESPVRIDRSRPAGVSGAGVIEFMHQRGHPGNERQLLQRLIIPEQGEYVRRQTLHTVPEVRWYYQLGGLWVAEHETHGIIARIIVTSMLERYGFGVTGITNPVSGSLAPAASYVDVVGF